MVTKRWDVLSLGCAAVDDLLYVPSYPPPDAKVRVDRTERQCGGLGATALVAAARLGAHCAYGALLGEDELSRLVEETLRAEGIDTAPVVRRVDARPGHSVIVVGHDRATRNVFSVSGRSGADDLLPGADTIRAARVLFVDYHGIPGVIRAARIARDAGIPVVADLERDDGPRFDELLDLIDHLIVSVGFARRLTGASLPADAVRRLWTPRRRAVVVTCGDAGAWFAESDAPVRHLPAFPVEVLDTTGCGDVFHGAYAATLAEGLDLSVRVRLASAAAALKATRSGGQRGIPGRAEVERFLQTHSDQPAETAELRKET